MHTSARVAYYLALSPVDLYPVRIDLILSCWTTTIQPPATPRSDVRVSSLAAGLHCIFFDLCTTWCWHPYPKNLDLLLDRWSTGAHLRLSAG